MKIKQQYLFPRNYGGKFKTKPWIIVIHHSATACHDSMWNYFNLASSNASAHYSVCTDGQITEMVPIDHVAWHAGKSQWGSLIGVNNGAIGIEVVSADGKQFTHGQKLAVKELIRYLADEFGIERENIVRHTDITQYDKSRLVSKTLASEDDAYNIRNCRKWDIGVEFYHSQGYNSWIEYRNSCFESTNSPTMGEYEKLLRSLHTVNGKLSVEGIKDPESILNVKDIREAMALILLLRAEKIPDDWKKDIYQLSQKEYPLQAYCSVVAPIVQMANNGGKKYTREDIIKEAERVAKENKWNIANPNAKWKDKGRLFKAMFPEHPFIWMTVEKGLEWVESGKMVSFAVDASAELANDLRDDGILNNYYKEKDGKDLHEFNIMKHAGKYYVVDQYPGEHNIAEIELDKLRPILLNAMLIK